VLPGHTRCSPCSAPASSGTALQGQENTTSRFAFGFAEVQPDRVTILAEIAERADEIDSRAGDIGKKRAEERLAQLTGHGCRAGAHLPYEIAHPPQVADSR